MEQVRNSDTDRLKQHDSLYKLKTPPWKETFRERCYERFKNSRRRLVDKFRFGLELNAEETNDALMKEDWKTMSKENNLLSNYFPVNSDELDETDVFIGIMEEIKREVLEEGKKQLEEYEAYEESSINAAIDMLELDEVICPFCQRNPLYQIHTVIFCVCGMQIDVQQDGFTLQDLKTELHKGIDLHEQACNVAPSFLLINLSESTDLVISCSGCSFMHTVI